jgi:hypothetical protein
LFFPSKGRIIDEGRKQCEPRNGMRAFNPVDGYSRVLAGMIATRSTLDPGWKAVFGKIMLKQKVRL